MDIPVFSLLEAGRRSCVGTLAKLIRMLSALLLLAAVGIGTAFAAAPDNTLEMELITSVSVSCNATGPAVTLVDRFREIGRQSGYWAPMPAIYRVVTGLSDPDQPPDDVLLVERNGFGTAVVISGDRPAWQAPVTHAVSEGGFRHDRLAARVDELVADLCILGPIRHQAPTSA